MPRRDIIIFDVCNTLYDSNTTFDFIRFVLAQGRRWKLVWFKLLTFKLSPVFIGFTLLGKLHQKDLLRNNAVQLLKGFSKKELQELATAFYRQYLQEKKMPDTLQMLEGARLNGEVWLFSNSLEPVIEAIAKDLHVSYEATQLAYNSDGTFTGKISRDLSGKKKDIFEQRFGKHASIKMMCSDNHSDQEILKLAEKPYVVLYREADRKFWEQLNPTFIEKF